MCHLLRVHYTGCDHHVTLGNIFPCSHFSVGTCDLAQWFPGWGSTLLNTVSARHVFTTKVGAHCHDCSNGYIRERLGINTGGGGTDESDDPFERSGSDVSTDTFEAQDDDPDHPLSPVGSSGPYWIRLDTRAHRRNPSADFRQILDSIEGHYRIAPNEQARNDHEQYGTRAAQVAGSSETRPMGPRYHAEDCCREVRQDKSTKKVDFRIKHKWLGWNWGLGRKQRTIPAELAQHAK